MNPTELPDKELISLCKKNLSYFAYLYKRYLNSVYKYCFFRVGQNKEIAEDITSEVFVKAVENFNSFEYKNKPFVVWLYSIAHNLICDHFRSKKENLLSVDAFPIEPDEKYDYLEDLSKEELINLIKNNLKNLPEEALHILTLRYSEELSFKEIASLLGKEEGAVKMKFYRSLLILKEIITKKNVTSESKVS